MRSLWENLAARLGAAKDVIRTLVWNREFLYYFVGAFALFVAISLLLPRPAPRDLPDPSTRCAICQGVGKVVCTKCRAGFTLDGSPCAACDGKGFRVCAACEEKGRKVEKKAPASPK